MKLQGLQSQKRSYPISFLHPEVNQMVIFFLKYQSIHLLTVKDFCFVMEDLYLIVKMWQNIFLFSNLEFNFFVSLFSTLLSPPLHSFSSSLLFCFSGCIYDLMLLVYSGPSHNRGDIFTHGIWEKITHMKHGTKEM